MPALRNKISNKPLHFIPQETRKRRTKPKVSRRKELIKIRAEINEIDTRKMIEMIKETKNCFFEKTNKIDKPLAN